VNRRGAGAGARSAARKRFGQHFLERSWVEKAIQAIAPAASDTFIEIGPGRGALTLPLARAAGSVIAFEIDRDLARSLRAAEVPRVLVVETDFLQVTAPDLERTLRGAGIDGLARSSLRVAGNLPYNVAAPILFNLMTLYRAGLPLRDATVMVQREVADRLLAPPGTRDYGVLSVLVGHTAAVDRLLSLPSGAFRPAPKVESTLVRLRFHGDDPVARNRQSFEELVRSVFTRRRKTLANALQAYRGLEKPAIDAALARAGLDGTLRPERLTISEFVRLSDALEDRASRSMV
jgi:16S rRNA (adenine1518-N6/adenine1519-N6)-dimethyltransferase